jgi:hypothetical protein
MMRAIKYILAVVFGLVSSLQVMAQDRLVPHSQVKQDTVLIRWAPINTETMRLGLKFGYRIERIDKGSGAFENNPTLQTDMYAPGILRIAEYLESGNKLEQEYGSVINAFIQKDKLDETAEQQLFGILLLGSGADKKLLEMLGLISVDTKFARNKTYSYRIGIPSKDGKSLQTSVTTDVNTSANTIEPKITTLLGEAQSKKERAYLAWNAAELLQDYSSFWIERSLTPDFATHTPVNKRPYLFFRTDLEPDKVLGDYVDTTVKQGNTYYYRVRGITFFGRPGKASNVVEVKIRRVLRGAIWIDSSAVSEDKRTITAHYTLAQREKETDVASYVLMRSDSTYVGYNLVGSTPATGLKVSMTYTSPMLSGDRNYFRVGAVSVDNDTLFSDFKYVFTLDQEPPSAPKGLQAKIDSLGAVQLTWDKNPEADIRGYRVFLANALHEEFIELTTEFAVEPRFADTLLLNNLTPTAFYAVRVVDLNYNNSAWSDTVEVIKPDTIAPVPCVLNGYRSLSNGMELTWVNSTSKDFGSSTLYRHEGEVFVKVAAWTNELSMLVDTNLVAGNSYGYHIETKDKSGNSARSEQFYITFETGIREGVAQLTSEVDRAQQQITIKWEHPTDEVFHYKIYRIKNDGKLRIIKTLKGAGASEFVDTDLYINNTYTYKIKTLYQSGISSNFSQALEVVY